MALTSGWFVFLVVGMVVVLADQVVVAKEFIVGDETGWTFGFDYQAWAQDKHFLVGDKLVFNYPVGAHNVFKVNGTGFQNCIIPPANEALTTGNDIITLATPGRKWYICGVGKHCALGGQKLFITVQPSLHQADPSPTIAPSQALPYTSSANGFTTSVYHLVVVATVMIMMVIMV